MKTVLASASPRRRELLELIGLRGFEVLPASGEPELTGLEPDATVKAVAMYKAESVRQIRPDCLIIAADTLVYLDGTPLGKPSDETNAERMLKMLSGRRHTVYTGVAILTPESGICRAEATDVYFRELNEREIKSYIATGEPMDKAGAYGAQGAAAVFISRIDGDFFNVMGLPVCRLTLMAKELGIDLALG